MPESSIREFGMALVNNPWTELYDEINVNKKTEIFHSTLTGYFNKYLPEKSVVWVGKTFGGVIILKFYKTFKQTLLLRSRVIYYKSSLFKRIESNNSLGVLRLSSLNNNVETCSS